MRFLSASRDQEWSITANLISPPAPYAVLSHTWGADEDEVTLKDVRDRSNSHKAGWLKLDFCASQAQRDGIDYIWIDTCCIDKTNQVELSEAITSMFRWYSQARKCYVYLSDVSFEGSDGAAGQGQWEAAFRASRWFQRGWTLQELLAPTIVEFFSRERKHLGSKATLDLLIHEITGIPVSALRGQTLSSFGVDERLKWSEGRQTGRIEDQAYCLLGIFDVSMSLRYGEGNRALERLQRKVKPARKSTEDSDLINWLAPSRSHELHARASRLRNSETGLHFTRGPLLSWLNVNDTSQSSLMWITGKSGTGKTTLFSHIVDTTQSFVSDNSSVAFAYHYCAFSDPETQPVINILGSLVAQLSRWQPDLLEDVRKLFERDRQRSQVKTLQIAELEQILVRHSARLQKFIVLFDALNESDQSLDTYACIERLLRNIPHLKVLTTSTTYAPPLGQQPFFVLQQIQIEPFQDIVTYVRFNLDNHTTLSHLSADCKNAIRTMLVGKADNSFRWVSLVLDRLGRERTEQAVLNALLRIPKNLSDVYGKTLGLIAPTDRMIAREVLLWVCFASRPLSLDELNEAAILDTCGRFLDPQARLLNRRLILEICHGLLDYDESSFKVKFAHSSVKAYLLSQYIKEDGNEFYSLSKDEGHRILTNRCLKYLLLDNFKRGVCVLPSDIVTLQRDFPLLGYAAHYWGIHASRATGDEWQLAHRLFRTKSTAHGGNYGVWGSCLMPYWEHDVVLKTEPLYYAASLGLFPLVKALLSGKLGQDARYISTEREGGRFDSTALQVACFRAQKESAKCLIAAGANFCVYDPGTGRPAWFWAKCNGWEGIVLEMVRLRPELRRIMEVRPGEVQWAQDFQRFEAAKGRMSNPETI